MKQLIINADDLGADVYEGAAFAIPFAEISGKIARGDYGAYDPSR